MVHARPADAVFLQRFFKTGPGQYGEGDVFVGVRVPSTRQVCRACRAATLPVIRQLLRSRIHEERLLALFLLVDAFTRGDEVVRRRIYDLYLASTGRINNWDLVDASAPAIVGGWLFDRSRTPLAALATSSSIWERRIAIIATQYFIRRRQLDDTFRIAEILLADPEDLIHKAVGWMLREAGKRDAARLRRFLDGRAARMPRTMLRYAIERFDESERQQYLKSYSKATRSPGTSRKDSSPRKSSGPNRKPKP
jgi:3-methyladenine DNA glycosylase AlkD